MGKHERRGSKPLLAPRISAFSEEMKRRGHPATAGFIYIGALLSIPVQVSW